MLRHFKMELKRQQLEQIACQENINSMSSSSSSSPSPIQPAGCNQPTNLTTQTKIRQQNITNDRPQVVGPKRVRGRRSSKPMMEKRRRARINECLDILKSYVLTDTDNLAHLGIDVGPEAGMNENRDEETIARTILKTSGLINRHRGRKNPNKLEKADILELTVDYVRRLHEQRDQLLNTSTQNTSCSMNHSNNKITTFAAAASIITTTTNESVMNNHNHYQRQALRLPEYIPAHLNQPLTLDLSPKSRLINQSTPPSPPPSSASSSPNADLLSVNTNDKINHHHHHHQQPYNMSKMILSRVLDGNYAGLYDWKVPNGTYQQTM